MKKCIILIVLLFVIGCTENRRAEKYPLENPSAEWIEKFGDNNESIAAYNIVMNRHILTSHYKKIYEINERLKAIDDSNEPDN